MNVGTLTHQCTLPNDLERFVFKCPAGEVTCDIPREAAVVFTERLVMICVLLGTRCELAGPLFEYVTPPLPNCCPYSGASLADD